MLSSGKHLINVFVKSWNVERVSSLVAHKSLQHSESPNAFFLILQINLYYLTEHLCLPPVLSCWHTPAISHQVSTPGEAGLGFPRCLCLSSHLPGPGPPCRADSARWNLLDWSHSCSHTPLPGPGTAPSGPDSPSPARPACAPGQRAFSSTRPGPPASLWLRDAQTAAIPGPASSLWAGRRLGSSTGPAAPCSPPAGADWWLSVPWFRGGVPAAVYLPLW